MSTAPTAPTFHPGAVAAARASCAGLRSHWRELHAAHMKAEKATRAASAAADLFVYGPAATLRSFADFARTHADTFAKDLPTGKWYEDGRPTEASRVCNAAWDACMKEGRARYNVPGLHAIAKEAERLAFAALAVLQAAELAAFDAAGLVVPMADVAYNAAAGHGAPVADAVRRCSQVARATDGTLRVVRLAAKAGYTAAALASDDGVMGASRDEATARKSFSSYGRTPRVVPLLLCPMVTR